MEIVLVAALLGLIPAYIAQDRGHSALQWWFFGALLFIVALPMALMLPRQNAGEVEQERVLSAVEDEPGASVQRLAARSGLHLRQVIEAVASLRDDGRVRLEKTGRIVQVEKKWLVPELHVPDVKVFSAEGSAGDASIPPAPAPSSQIPAPPNAATSKDAPSGWYPDPAGAFDHRWWDGTQWTSTVAQKGTRAQSEPPLGAATPDPESRAT